jgi:serine/threonine protein kinase
MSFPIANCSKASVNEFRIICEDLGSGNFCQVSHAIDLRNGEHVALKRISKTKVQRLRKEKDVLMEKHALQRYAILIQY